MAGASTQSSRRRTVSGSITSWYLPRLKVSRIRSATPQMKLTIWLWFMAVLPPAGGQSSVISASRITAASLPPNVEENTVMLLPFNGARSAESSAPWGQAARLGPGSPSRSLRSSGPRSVATI